MARPAIVDRLAHAWNAFTSPDNVSRFSVGSYGGATGYRPDRTVLRGVGDKSIVNSVLARMAIDVSLVDIRHARMDENKRYIGDILSGLNDCFNTAANVDQAADHFKRDIALRLFAEGAIAIVPIDTTLNPKVTGSYDINSMRIGSIVNWYPRHVRVNIYNDQTGLMQEVTLPKSMVAIIENPLFSVMNENQGILQRLLRKLSLLDVVDEAVSSGKLDLIIQLPYVVKTEARKIEAQNRAIDLNTQLKNSALGVAYTDGTEKITQLNRPADNQLLSQIEYLTKILYDQLGITPEVMNGTADQAAMLNYFTRTIDPILKAITQSINRTFLTQTARTQGQGILFFRDPFALVPITDMADLADKLTRNEILTSNDFRGVIGFRPSDAPNADELRNKNLPLPLPPGAPATGPAGTDPNDPASQYDPNADPEDDDNAAPAPAPTEADPADVQDIFDNLQKKVTGILAVHGS